MSLIVIILTFLPTYRSGKQTVLSWDNAKKIVPCWRSCCKHLAPGDPLHYGAVSALCTGNCSQQPQDNFQKQLYGDHWRKRDLAEDEETERSTNIAFQKWTEREREEEIFP